MLQKQSLAEKDSVERIETPKHRYSILHLTPGIIVLLMPGIIVLYGMAYASSTVRAWISVGHEPSFYSFVRIILGTMVAGLCVNSFRKVIVETIHHRTGLLQPPWEKAKSTKHGTAVEKHFIEYRFLTNWLVATLFASATAAWRLSAASGRALTGKIYLDLLVIGIVLFGFLVASRCLLKRYYRRVNALVEA